LTPPAVSENMVPYMRFPVMTLSVMLLTGCAARRPAYVVVPRANCRSEEPVTLPLTAEGRQRLEAFLGHGGRPQATDPVPDPAVAEHRRVLDALEKASNLDVNTTNSTARRFCDDAAKLCGETSLFGGKPFVRQVVDARETRRPVTAPLAVADNGYWWIFKVRDGRLTEVVLVCAVERSIER
jgi:hypothetical protein